MEDIQNNSANPNVSLNVPPRLTLPNFEGPLDLLLYVIQKNEMDIHDIPIVEVTRQYSEHLSMMKEIPLAIASEYVFLAATLIYIKSKILLPQAEEENGEEIEDPRQFLVDQLLEYQRAKKLSQELLLLEEKAMNILTRDGIDDSDGLIKADLYDIMTALRNVLEKAAESGKPMIVLGEPSLAERITEILDLLSIHGSLPFEKLFNSDDGIAEIIITFLALLELLKKGAVKAYQDNHFSSIRIALV